MISHKAKTPDEAGYSDSQRFDFDRLNEELATYGLRASPPSAASGTVRVQSAADNG